MTPVYLSPSRKFMTVAGKMWCQKSHGKHKNYVDFPTEACTFPTSGISELVIFYLNTEVILISAKRNAIHA